MAAFIPPLWSKFGTQAKDLLSKKYDYKNQLTAKNNVAADLTVESTVTVADNSALSGTVKTKYKNKDFGEVEAEIGTVPNKDKATLSGEVKATKLYDGLVVSAKGTDVWTAKLGAEYRHESVAGSLTFEATKDSHQIEGTIAAGFDGFSVGGQSRYCFNHGLSDYNFGAEYSQPEYALTLKTEKKADVLVGSYWHNVPTSRNKLKTQVGAQVSWDLSGTGNKVFTVGTEHEIDEVTTVKGKIDTEGQLAAVLEHRLTNPFMKLGLSANWKVQDKTTTPNKFGVALTFGDL